MYTVHKGSHSLCLPLLSSFSPILSLSLILSHHFTLLGKEFFLSKLVLQLLVVDKHHLIPFGQLIMLHFEVVEHTM